MKKGVTDLDGNKPPGALTGRPWLVVSWRSDIGRISGQSTFRMQ